MLYQDYKQAKANADSKSEESVRADRDAKDIEKLTARAIMTEMLNDPNYEEKSGSLYDGVSVQTLKNLYNEIRIANQDKELRTRVLMNLKPEDQAAFVSCRFKNYDQMDNVMVQLANARSALAREKQSQQDQQRRNETSNATRSDKAANDYNGSSGK